MRRALILAFVLNLGLALAALAVSPPKVAIHFGTGGIPDGWAPAYVNSLLMVGLDALILLLFLFTPLMIRRTPARWINLPNKAYWLGEENRNRMELILTRRLDQFGAVTFLLLFLLGLLVLQANLSNPVHLREDILWWGMGAYVIYSVGWTLRLKRDFRVPKTAR